MTIAESWHDLETDLLGPEPDYDAEPIEIDRSTADRYLRRIAHLDAKYAADQEVAEAQIEHVRAWLGRRYEAHAAQRAWYSGVLRRFHEALLAMDPSAKTVKLPAGELHVRAQPDAWTIDAEQYLPWAVEHAPDTVRTVPETTAVDMRAAKAALSATPDGRAVNDDGEIVPGVTVAPNDPKFSVVVNAAEIDPPTTGGPF